MKYLILLITLGITLVSCGGSTSTGAAADVTGYDTETVKGTNVTRAVKKNADGLVMEEGYISGGKRNGMWVTYFDGDYAGRIKTMASYSDGMLNGPYVELTNRSQIEKEVNYANNKYNGKFVQYKFGRIEKEINYIDNELNGVTREYDNKGEIQKEINYKNGQLDGLWRVYNQEGDVTLEYEYKNGEKISGGMVEKKEE